MINKRWCKNGVWFSYVFSIFFLTSSRFPGINPTSAPKYLMYFLAGINKI